MFELDIEFPHHEVLKQLVKDHKLLRATKEHISYDYGYDEYIRRIYDHNIDDYDYEYIDSFEHFLLYSN